MEQLFEVVRDDPIELGVILAAFYGLRRSEAVGLKWDAIDFEQKTITIRHTVTQVCVNGKSTIIEKDRTKTKSSYRTLPLVPPFEELLYRLQAQQEMNRKLCGRMYNKEFSGYIYVNEMGELVKPGYITQHFPLVLQKNGMRKIRFHDAPVIIGVNQHPEHSGVDFVLFYDFGGDTARIVAKENLNLCIGWPQKGPAYYYF